MQSVGSGVSSYLARVAPREASAVRIAQNNQRFERAIRRTWFDNPHAADFLLAHINSLYVKKDDRPRKGGHDEAPRFVMGVYVDDATARAELNARRELLVLAATQEGLSFEDIILHNATRGMKERRAYPHAVERLAAFMRGEAPADEVPGASVPTSASASDSASADGGRTGAHAGRAPGGGVAADQTKLLETVKRAFCLAFEDFEQAWSILERVEGAVLEETSVRRGKRGTIRRYWCHLYVDPADVEAMADALRACGETVSSCARSLKLNVQAFQVHPSPETLRGQQAFPRVGSPRALRNPDMRALREARLRAGRR